MPTVQRVAVLEKRDCASCHKPIELGDIAVKKHRKGLGSKWYHIDCWKRNA